MFGAAIDETPELMPMPIAVAHALTDRYTNLYHTNLPYLRPDGKAQAVIVYEKGKPVAVHKIIVAASHHKSISMERLR